MNKIHLDQSWSLSRLWGSSIARVLITGAVAWTGGYMAAGHTPTIGKQAIDASANAFTGLFSKTVQPTEQMSASYSDLDANMNAATSKAGLLKRVVLDFDPRKQPLDDYNKLILAARDDQRFRQDIIKQFENVTDPRLKDRLTILMTQIGTPDMKGYAQTLSTSSDPAKRSDGFRILANLDSTRTNAEVRRELIGALEKETNGNALQSLIMGMSPGEIRPPQEVAVIVQRLSDLSKHPDVAVRAAAIGSIARWGEASKIEGVITEALGDPNPDVITAAMHASTEAGIRTPAVKNMLFQLAAQPNANIDFRRYAASTLSNYNLNAQDFEHLMQLRQELGARDM